MWQFALREAELVLQPKIITPFERLMFAIFQIYYAAKRLLLPLAVWYCVWLQSRAAMHCLMWWSTTESSGMALRIFVFIRMVKPYLVSQWSDSDAIFTLFHGIQGSDISVWSIWPSKRQNNPYDPKMSRSQAARQLCSWSKWPVHIANGRFSRLKFGQIGPKCAICVYIEIHHKKNWKSWMKFPIKK